jgi:hypothetical protein
VSSDYPAFIEHYMREHPGKEPAWAPTLEPALPMAAFRSFLWARLLFDGASYWQRPGTLEGKCERAGVLPVTAGAER